LWVKQTFIIPPCPVGLPLVLKELHSYVYETTIHEADLACGTKPFSEAQNAYKNKNIRELYKFKISRKIKAATVYF